MAVVEERQLKGAFRRLRTRRPFFSSTLVTSGGRNTPSTTITTPTCRMLASSGVMEGMSWKSTEWLIGSRW